MEDRHKQILRRNRVALVERLKPPELYDALLEKRVFSQDMIDEIKVRLCTVLCAQEQVPLLLSQLVSTKAMKLVMVAVLRHQAGSGQAAGRRLGDSRESSFSVVPGESTGDGSVRVGRAPAERSPGCSHSASNT